MVGRTIGGRLVGLGHEVMLGSRTADNADATAWAAEIGDRATHGAVVDLGDIKSARGAEAFVLFWVFLRGALGGNQFNVGVVPPPASP
jgi:predicted dinucleotide-binding enzyme